MERVHEGPRPEAGAERLVLEEWELAPSEESVANSSSNAAHSSGVVPLPAGALPRTAGSEFAAALAVADGRSQALAFAELFSASSREEVLALSRRGGGVVELARTLLASVSPGGSYESGLLPAGAREDAATNPAIARGAFSVHRAGFCSCGRTLAQGGGRQHLYCCRHCPLGTHSGGCERRERLRVRS